MNKIILTCYADGRVERRTRYQRGHEVDAMAFYVGIAPQIDKLEQAVVTTAGALKKPS